MLCFSKDGGSVDLRGNVKFCLEEGVEICCQHLICSDHESEQFKMDGDVSIEVGEVRFQGEHVSINTSEDGVSLSGKAKVIQKDKRRSFAAEKIYYDLHNQTVKLDDAPELHHLPLEVENSDVIHDGQVLPSAYYFVSEADGKLKSSSDALQEAKKE